MACLGVCFEGSVGQPLLLDLSKHSRNELLGVGNPSVEGGRCDCGNFMIAATGPLDGVCVCAMNYLMTTEHCLLKSSHILLDGRNIQPD